MDYSQRILDRSDLALRLTALCVGGTYGSVPTTLRKAGGSPSPHSAFDTLLVRTRLVISITCSASHYDHDCINLQHGFCFFHFGESPNMEEIPKSELKCKSDLFSLKIKSKVKVYAPLAFG